MDGGGNQSINQKEELIKSSIELNKALNDQKNSTKNLKNSEKHYSMLIKKMSEGLALYKIILDKEGKPYDLRFIDINSVFGKLLNLKKHEVIGKTMLEVLRKDELGRFDILKKVIAEISMSRKPMQIEVYSQIPDKYYEVTIYFPGREYLATVVSDVTEKKRLEEKTKRLSNLKDATKTVGKVLLRSNNEKELYQKICNILMKTGFIRFVWIGLTEEGNFDVKPVAYAGYEEGYLSIIKVKWDDSIYGNGVIGTAIKTGRSSIVANDVRTQQKSFPWLKEALKRNYLSLTALPLIHENKIIGALNVYSDKKDAFSKEEVEFLEEAANDIAVGVKAIRLEKGFEQSNISLKKALEQIIATIVKIAEMKDPYTAGHQVRVSQLTTAIAKKMKLSEDRVESLRIASLIHDIGKVAIPTEILTKPTKLTEQEFSLIKNHPVICYDCIKDIDFSGKVAEIVLQHHEKLDGSGYPKGLKDKEILPEAKMLCVADVVEAMSSHRPYRPALGIDKALEEISMNKGKLYDPEVADVCMKLFKEDGFKFQKIEGC